MERSCLFSIEPIGIRTIKVESLSSYISRLKDAHCVTVGDIMKHIIAPKLNNKYINNMVFKGGHGFYKSSSAINGHGNIADQCNVQIYSQSWHRNSIHSARLSGISC
nr:TniQ family protein [Lysinibacillus sp. HST-98]